MAKLKLFPRYRKPSTSTLIGVNKAKRRIKKVTGISKIDRVANAPINLECRVKKKLVIIQGQ